MSKKLLSEKVKGNLALATVATVLIASVAGWVTFYQDAKAVLNDVIDNWEKELTQEIES